MGARGPIHLVITFSLFFFWFSLQDQKRFRILGYWVSDCFVLLPMFTSFYLDQFLLVYFTILSQYPHTWLFYTGCISEHAIAAKGCVWFLFIYFFLYHGGDESELTLLLTHRGALLRTFPFDIVQSCSSLCEWWEVLFFSFLFSSTHLFSMLYVLIRSRAHWWILHHISVLLLHQAGSVRFIR